jgi:hypothetical protein
MRRCRPRQARAGRPGDRQPRHARRWSRRRGRSRLVALQPARGGGTDDRRGAVRMDMHVPHPRLLRLPEPSGGRGPRRPARAASTAWSSPTTTRSGRAAAARNGPRPLPRRRGGQDRARGGGDRHPARRGDPARHAGARNLRADPRAGRRRLPAAPVRHPALRRRAAAGGSPPGRRGGGAQRALLDAELRPQAERWARERGSAARRRLRRAHRCASSAAAVVELPRFEPTRDSCWRRCGGARVARASCRPAWSSPGVDLRQVPQAFPGA